MSVDIAPHRGSTETITMHITILTYYVTILYDTATICEDVATYYCFAMSNATILKHYLATITEI